MILQKTIKRYQSFTEEKVKCWTDLRSAFCVLILKFLNVQCESVFIFPTHSEVVDLFHIIFDLWKDSSAWLLKVSCIYTTGLLLCCEQQHNKLDNRKQKTDK